MRLLFFTDAHGNQYSLRSLYESLPKICPDIIIFGGDIFGYYYGQKEVISYLKKMKCKCLLGNHDKYFLDLYDGKMGLDYLVGRYGSSYEECLRTISENELDFLNSFNSRFDIEEDGLHLAFVHGSVVDPLEGRIYPDSEINDLEPYNGLDYVFFGHTHHNHVRVLENGTTLVNPGSIGQQRDGTGCKYVIFDTDKRLFSIQSVFYDRDLLVKEIQSHHEAKEMENKLIEVLYRDNEE